MKISSKIFHTGDALSAIQYNLDLARAEWYNSAKPHSNCMEFIRKITALGIKMGVANGMPMRVDTTFKGESTTPLMDAIKK